MVKLTLNVVSVFEMLPLKDNISELSIDSKRLIVDHMHSNGIKPESMDISTPMIVAYKSARTKYVEEKRKTQQAKQNLDKENLKKQLSNQITQLNSNVNDIQKTIDFLDEEFEESVFNAENKSPEEQTLQTPHPKYQLFSEYHLHYYSENN